MLHIFVTRLCNYDKDYTISCGERKKNKHDELASGTFILNQVKTRTAFSNPRTICPFVAYDIFFIIHSKYFPVSEGVLGRSF